MSASGRRSLRRSAAALALLVLGGCGASASAPTRTHAAHCIRAPGHGVIDNEVAYIPRRLPKHPALVLAFHGLHQPPSVLEQQTGLDAVASRNGFVVIYPSAQTGSHWQLNARAGDVDTRYIRSLIRLAIDRVCVDPRRVYATGFSMGGSFAFRLGCDLADQIAAIAPVSGSYRSQDPCPPGTRPMPTLEVHGRDPWTSTTSSLIAATKARNHCTRAPITRQIAAGVTRTVWPGCRLERIYNRRIGHEWLTHGAYNTSIEVWRFFASSGSH